MEDLELLLDTLLRQEEALQFDSFSNEIALDVGMRLVAAARAIGTAVAVEIRSNGQLIFHHAMDGCTPDHAEWIRRKSKVVQRYARSSLFMGNCYRRRGTTFEAHTGLDPHEYGAKGGAFPLRVRRCGMIGTITVSGLSQEDDHALVVGVLGSLIGAAGGPQQRLQPLSCTCGKATSRAGSA